MVMGLLLHAPMHGYEMQKLMEQTRADAWAEVLPGSLYHALKKMTDEGLVRVKATEQTGHRLRAIYEITSDGRRAFQKLLRETWQERSLPFPVSLYVGVTFLSELPKAEALQFVDARIAALEADMADWKLGLVQKAGAPPQIHILMESALSHLETDVKMLQKIRAGLKKQR